MFCSVTFLCAKVVRWIIHKEWITCQRMVLDTMHPIWGLGNYDDESFRRSLLALRLVLPYFQKSMPL